jgi:hypothetical protein
MLKIIRYNQGVIAYTRKVSLPGLPFGEVVSRSDGGKWSWPVARVQLRAINSG